MKIQELGIHGCFLMEHEVFPDERGLFREWFKLSKIVESGIDFKVAQANFSLSEVGVIRGLHYSLSPEGQSKLVTCVQGSINDYLIDIRIGSPTYLKKAKIKLAADSGASVFIDSGVAHGFSVPSEISAICYLTSSEFTQEYEKAINPLDPTLDVNWSIKTTTEKIISKSDLNAVDYNFAQKNNLLPIFTRRILDHE